MRSPGFLAAWFVVVVVVAFSGVPNGIAQTPSEADSTFACPVTVPNGRTYTEAKLAPLLTRRNAPTITDPNGTPLGNHGNDALSTGLWPDGTVVFKQSGPGYVLDDGALMMKFWWWRLVPGQLTFEGRRLDAPAPPLRARVPEGYGPIGFQSTGLIFPTPGCWEVTGRVGEKTLTFVTQVRKLW